MLCPVLTLLQFAETLPGPACTLSVLYPQLAAPVQGTTWQGRSILFKNLAGCDKRRLNRPAVLCNPLTDQLAAF